jgi:serine/threonine protein phosphatase PrpC
MEKLTSESETHTLSIEYSVIPLGKKQDYITSGTCIDEETGLRCPWIAAFDGHGTDDAIQTIRSMDLSAYISSSTPIQKIEKYIADVSDHSDRKKKWFCSGSTVSIVKVFPDKILCMNSGDSQTAVFLDEEFVYINTPHSMDHPVEVERMKKILPFHDIVEIPKYGMSSLTSMKKENVTYIVYSEPERMCMVTQSLGHLQMLPCEPEVKIVEYTAGQNLTVVIGTDGFFDMSLFTEETEMQDMMHCSAYELAKKVEERWLKQDWRIVSENEEPNYGGYDEKNRDDIGVGKLVLRSKTWSYI